MGQDTNADGALGHAPFLSTSLRTLRVCIIWYPAYRPSPQYFLDRVDEQTTTTTMTTTKATVPSSFSGNDTVKMTLRVSQRRWQFSNLVFLSIFPIERKLNFYTRGVGKMFNGNGRMSENEARWHLFERRWGRSNIQVCHRKWTKL